MARQGLNSSANSGVPSANRFGVRHWAASTAARRVADYLRALGLRDRACLEELSVAIAGAVSGSDEREHARRAVAEAQRRFEAWRGELYAVLPKEVSPLWLKEFIAAHPHLFLGDLELGRAAAQTFGDPRTGRKPPRARFSTQHFEPAMFPRWLAGALPALLLTLLGSGALGFELARGGLTLLEGLWVAVFSFLFLQLGLGASTAVLGFVSAWRQRAEQKATSRASASHLHAMDAALPKTALLVPIYHESAEEVFAALAAMREALAARPEAGAFEVFVLSDSRDPVVSAEEEAAFRVVAAEHSSVPIYYHRRAVNDRQKAGNLAEFFESWGPRYTYAVVLDADSIMSADTLIGLVRRMEAEPRTALLQAPIVLHGAETPFARALQFASSVCGPLFTRGLDTWAGPHGNYYGHNAVIRVNAFLSCCALPKLKGKPPLGGDVLSHDFVEAALLCRADWEVRSAPELSGSYEGVPPTLPEYIARDRRWCQGNLQHVTLAATHGLKPMSRIHLLMGAAAYLASPAWLSSLVLAVVLWEQGTALDRVGPLLIVATALLLGTPWLLGLIEAVRDPRTRRSHRGVLALSASVVGSVLLGAVVAPILMLQHTRIVTSILTGSAVRWGAQRRRAAGSVAAVVRSEWLTTLCGAGAAAGLWLTESMLFWWLAPVWVPWLLAIPIALVVSSPRIGIALRRLGIFAVPTETAPEPLLARAEELRSLTRPNVAQRYRDLVLDPVLLETHLARLEPGGPRASRALLDELRRRVLREGAESLSADEWHLLSEDAESMRRLHREAWQRWSVESWGQAREQPLVPSDADGVDVTLGNPPERAASSVKRPSEPLSLRASRARRRLRRSRSA